MKKNTRLATLLLAVCTLFSACGGGGGQANNGVIDDQAAFITAYNEAAVQVGAATFTEENIEPYVLNGQAQEEGFSLQEGVLQADMLTFTPGQVMLVGRPGAQFDAFYLESEAVLMALMGLSKEEADEMVYELYYKEDASETSTAGGGTTVQKTMNAGGITLSVSQTNGIYMLMFS
ncbi:hypothetical protein LJB77_02320 [Ruminococcaceae bacterium OttesenSCG-928-N02]|nr:hypothetical protein [Ruminococcaceae bacterium OttesenSCG-928-N02]